jgi:hypothetical protein
MLPFTNVGVLKRRIDVRVAMCVKKERESVCVWMRKRGNSKYRVNFWSNASERLWAGSVEMIRTFFLTWERRMERQEEVVVFPTPPLPPTKIHFSSCCSRMLARVGGSGSRSAVAAIIQKMRAHTQREKKKKKKKKKKKWGIEREREKERERQRGIKTWQRKDQK